MVFPQSQQSRTAINKSYRLNGIAMIGWKTMYLGPVILVALCGIHYSNSNEYTYCQAGQYLTKDPASKKDICLVCEPMTYMPKKNHQESSCYRCDEKPLRGSWKEVTRPCTWKSNTEIGCLRIAYRAHQRSDGFSCKPCTVCTDGQKETWPCSEYADRVCTEITPAGEDEKDMCETPSSSSSTTPSSSSSTTTTSTKAPEAVAEAKTSTAITSTGNTPHEKGRSSSTDAIPEQEAATKCQCYCNVDSSVSAPVWLIGGAVVVVVIILASGIAREAKRFLGPLLCRKESHSYGMTSQGDGQQK